MVDAVFGGKSLTIEFDALFLAGRVGLLNMVVSGTDAKTSFSASSSNCYGY